MKSNFEEQSNFEPLKQLELLNVNCENIKTDLYKVNAFYLKLIRSIIPDAIKEAIYQIVLSGQTNPNIFFKNKNKYDFQKRVEDIISEYISFLTIENLLTFSEGTENENI